VLSKPAANWLNLVNLANELTPSAKSLSVLVSSLKLIQVILIERSEAGTDRISSKQRHTYELYRVRDELIRKQ